MTQDRTPPEKKALEKDIQIVATNETGSLAGKVVAGRYEIISVIGSGGAGVVCRARHIELDKIVALKLLPANRLQDARDIARFRQEARAATSLSHPNIGAVREFGLDENLSPYIVMDYVEGRSLAEMIKEKALEPATALQIARGVCLGLEHAHEHGVVHRDIKPENIIVTKTADGSLLPVIVDFGLAGSLLDSESLSRLTRTGEVFGTPAYMSPEQALGYPVDGRTDIYTLGVVLYEMLTGKQPFAVENPLVMMMKHVSEPPAPMCNIPAEVQSIVMKAMAKAPEHRFASSADLRSALENVSANKKVIVSPGWSYTKTLGLRGLAWFIDALIIGLPCFIAGIVLILLFPRLDQIAIALAFSGTLDQIMPGLATIDIIANVPGALVLLGVLVSALNYFYHAAFESSERQGTPGKSWLGLAVTTRNFERISFREASIRHWSKIVNLLPVILIPGFIAIAIRPGDQGAQALGRQLACLLSLSVVVIATFCMRKLYQMPHDFVANTMVVPVLKKLKKQK